MSGGLGMAEALLEVRGLRLKLPEGSERSHALYGLDFSLEAGQLLCVVGESGSGKSSLAAALLRLLPAQVRQEAGTLRFAGAPLEAIPPRHLRGRNIALVSQEPLAALNPVQRIGRQVAEALQLHTRLPRRERDQRVIELLGYVGLPEPEALQAAYPFQLSGGQRQRVAIAIALACEPRLLIADEPTSALDAATRVQILDLLQRIQRERDMAVLLITHDFAVVRAVADQVLVLQAGRLVEQGEARAVLDSPKADYTRRLLAAASLQPRPVRAAVQTPPVLQALGVYKTHVLRHGWQRREVRALRGVDLTLRPGETLGIVGESGSGKSTLARALLRLLPVDSGHIHWLERSVEGLPERRLRAWRQQVQMVFQDPSSTLNPRRRIGEALLEGPLANGVPRAEAERRVRQWLDWVGLPENAFERYPHAFSGGQRQRIGIARALVMQPKVLIADECVSALDALVQLQILELLERVQDELGLALLFITHDLRVAARVCDRLAVMYRGEVVESGVTADLLDAPRHPYTRTLLAAQGGLHNEAS